METEFDYITPRKAGELLDLTHLEVIRRIRRNQIEAKKLDGGWLWVISMDEVKRVKKKDWYKRLMQLRAQRASD